MISLIAKQKDGGLRKVIDRPFKDSHVISFKDDVTTYWYAYDNIEEIAKEIDNICNRDDYDVIFKIENNKIIDVDVVSDITDSAYSDYSILFNGLIPVSEYVAELELL